MLLKIYLKTGDFYEVKITDAADFDLFGEPVNVNVEKPKKRKEFCLSMKSYLVGQCQNRSVF